MRAPNRSVFAGLFVVTACQGTVFDNGGTPFSPDTLPTESRDEGHRPEAVPTVQRRDAGPIQLRNVAAEVGLDGIAAGGNQHGSAVAFVQLRGDPRPDILLVNGINNVTGEAFASRLLVNVDGERFVDETQAAGLDILRNADGYSVAAADFDRDGDLDLYIGRSPRDLLLRNDDGVFQDVTDQLGAGGPADESALYADGRSKVVAWGDFDGDGWVDIVSASSALSGPGLYLLRNLEGRGFEDVTEAQGPRIHPRGNPCAVLWSDVDGDRRPDLWVWNDRGGHVLLKNTGSGFDDITQAAEVSPVRIRNPMGIDGADFDHDGDVDYYVSNIGNNPLLINLGDGTFEDRTEAMKTGGEYGWGLGFVDFDHDGWLDLFVAQEDERPHLVFHNRGPDAPFDRIEVEGLRVRDSAAAHNRSVAFADYDQDGRVDVLVGGSDGSPPALYRNETDVGTHQSLRIRLPAGPGAPAGHVGARVGVQVDGEVRFRDVHAGASRGAQNSYELHFGLGHLSGADWVRIEWPGRRAEVVYGVPAGAFAL